MVYFFVFVQFKILIISPSLAVEGLAVALTLTDPVPKSIRVAFHSFGLFAFIQGLCTVILTLSAPQCVSINYGNTILCA